MKPINFRMWHWRAIPTEVRPTFELPSWPFFIKDGEKVILDDCTAYLQSLGVVRVEVEGEVRKILIPTLPDCPQFEQSPYANKWKPPWKCYRSHGLLNDETLAILKWSKRHDNFERGVGKLPPDNCAWIEWNTRCDVLSMNSSFINYE